MARSLNSQPRNKEIWSSRRNNKKVRGCRLYRWSKKLTHRNERRAAKVHPLSVGNDE